MGRTLAGRFLVLDALHMEWRMLSLPKDPRCPVCGSSEADSSGDDGRSSGLEQTGS
jgi:adenylyltransferase/sulfurtransferase